MFIPRTLSATVKEAFAEYDRQHAGIISVTEEQARYDRICRDFELALQELSHEETKDDGYELLKDVRKKSVNLLSEWNTRGYVAKPLGEFVDIIRTQYHAQKAERPFTFYSLFEPG